MSNWNLEKRDREYIKFSIGLSHRNGQKIYKKINLKMRKNNKILIFFLLIFFFIKNSITKNKIIKNPTYMATVLKLIAIAANIDNKKAL